MKPTGNFSKVILGPTQTSAYLFQLWLNPMYRNNEEKKEKKPLTEITYIGLDLIKSEPFTLRVVNLR